MRSGSLPPPLDALEALDVARLHERYLLAEKRLRKKASPPYAIRLDGVGFGRALEGFSSPRDLRVHVALVQAAMAVVERFNAVGAWVGSDEVNVVMLGPENPYGGRVEKLVSVSAGIASAEVSLALGRRLFFDSRVVPLRDAEDAAKYVLYRARVALNNLATKLLQLRGVEPEGGFAERVRACWSELCELGDWVVLGTSVVWVWFVRRDRVRRRLAAYAGPWMLVDAILPP